MKDSKNDNKNQLVNIGKQPLTRVSKTLAITSKLLNEIENREPSDDFRVDIPDVGFQEYLKDIGVKVENGTVAYGDVKNIENIHCSLCRMTVNGWERGIEEGIEILSLEGINFFKGLTSLDCSEQKISHLNMSQNLDLEELDCWGNNLSSLDVSQNMNLTHLSCSYNHLKTLNVSKNHNLSYLHCDSNQLIKLDVSKNTNLCDLHCEFNQLTTLDVSENKRLEGLYISGNSLTTLLRACLFLLASAANSSMSFAASEV